MKDNKRLQILLLILLLIAGYAIYDMNSSATQKSSQKVVKKNKFYSVDQLKDLSVKIIEDKQKVPKYHRTSNDPFGGYETLKLTPKVTVRKSDEKKAPIQTQLKLSGIVWDDQKPIAILVHANGRSYNVTEKESIEGEEIIKITPNHVIVSKEKIKFKINMSGYTRVEK